MRCDDAAVKIVLGNDGVNLVTMDHEYMMLELASRLARIDGEISVPMDNDSKKSELALRLAAGIDNEISVPVDNDFKKLKLASRLAGFDGRISVPMDAAHKKLELPFLLAGFEPEISVPMDYDKAAAALAGNCVLTSSQIFEESKRALFFSKG